jgi:hypothetical protein
MSSVKYLLFPFVLVWYLENVAAILIKINFSDTIELV